MSKAAATTHPAAAAAVHHALCNAKKYAAYPASSPTANIPAPTAAARFRPISLRTAASAERHGVYRAKNAKNANACAGVNSAPISPPQSIASVPATASLAKMPLRRETDTRQSVIPIG